MSARAIARLARVERHTLGPRVFVLGRRVHECHLGLAVLIAGGAVALAGRSGVLLAVLLAAGAWLVAKDWRDLHPATRDTAMWRPGLHRRADLPRTPVNQRVPLLAACATALVGVVNVASALTPEVPLRLRALLAIAPVHEVALAHALALPAGLALLGAAWQLARRRRRALSVAVALLGLLGVLNLLKGLDAEEALISWTLAAVLWRARSAFAVRHSDADLPRALARAGAVLGGAFALALVAVLAAGRGLAPAVPTAAAPGRALALLALNTAAVRAAGPFAWLPLGIALLGIGAVIVAAALVFAPLRPRQLADGLDRRRAAALVRRHGADTLSAFKLRNDVLRQWSPDGRAMAAYRVEAGTMLVAGDPVGAPGATPGVLEAVIAHARRHGLALGVVGASEAFAAKARRAGLRRLYLGDEAILATGAMDLSGGQRKSLRKAVHRVERHGYVAELHAVGELDAATIAQLREVSGRWLDGAPDRGFSMAHDDLVDELLPDALVVLARDSERRVRGFLHFAPVFGRPVVSLGFMRRDRDTPNGLTDFLVVHAARLLAERGIEEFSLNFAAFGRWLRAPSGALERALGRLVRLGDRWFQIERLYRFNAKFEPHWQPRYLLFDRPLALPRVALAAMWAEGHLPKPRPLRIRPSAATARVAPARGTPSHP
jgi:lysyl-tRNA synthetase class 2